MYLFSVAGLATVPLVVTAQQPSTRFPRIELRNGIVPTGSLGQLLGRYLTIEGLRVEEGRVGVNTLLVDTVNGQKLPEPVPIWIENVDLPEAERCVVKGYENCHMIGLPPAVVEAARESGKRVRLPQAGWQMKMFFVATSVVSPNELRIRDGVGELKP
jgi:hypothetical protein